MKKILSIILGLAIGFTSYSQSLNKIKGKVLDGESANPVSDVTISVQDTDVLQLSETDGTFTLQNVPNGEQIVVFKKVGYESQFFPVTVNDNVIDLGDIMLYIDISQTIDNSIITLSEDDLSDDEAGGADNVAGILQSSKDTYQRAVAFNFGQVWFKERGYDSSYGQVSFNGMPMNKISNNRPQWSDWGGLNDVLRNQIFTNGLAASESTFGNVLGTTNFITRASEYREGGKASYAFTNSNYDGRAMASYNTGLMENGWAMTVLASRRFAQEGYMEGSSYNAWGGFLAVEKKLGKHSLNLTAFYTPNRRGKNSPNTQEVFDLGGLKYNAYWGYQAGEKRNSRMKEIKEPTFMLGHYWDINDKTTLNTNILYQMGTIGNSRLGYDTSQNPDPTYYKKLPSFYLSLGREDYQIASDYTYKFLNKEEGSQLLWNELYSANSTINADAAYYLYEDVSEDTTMAINSILNSQLNENTILNASILYKNTQSENYAHMMDLLGAKYQIDIDKYEAEGSDKSQNDLNNPNRQIVEGDKFSYDYNIDATKIDGFAQAQFNYEKLDFYLAGNIGQTSYQREGLYKNGRFKNTSYGKGEKQNFTTYGTKAGLTYKINGRNLISLNGGYMTKAPSLRNAYASARVYEAFVPNVTTEKILSGDLSYIYRAPGIKARLTGYYTTFKDASKVSFYYVQGLIGPESSKFLATNLTGINLKNIGGEFGIEAQITPTISVTGVAAVGQFTYDSNPNMYIITDENYDVGSNTDNTIQDYLGNAYLRNYKQSGTPQRGYSVGFSYRDPKYWWVSANANLLTHNYISLSEFRRLDNFYTDPFGNLLPFNDLTQEEVDTALAQEKFEDIFLVNLVGGKSWRIKGKYLGFFASINNLLGEDFKTGGFEQARKANFEELIEDQERETPTFGNKYWYGRNTSYYLNFYIRF